MHATAGASGSPLFIHIYHPIALTVCNFWNTSGGRKCWESYLSTEDSSLYVFVNNKICCNLVSDAGKWLPWDLLMRPCGTARKFEVSSKLIYEAYALFWSLATSHSCWEADATERVNTNLRQISKCLKWHHPFSRSTSFRKSVMVKSFMCPLEKCVNLFKSQLSLSPSLQAEMLFLKGRGGFSLKGKRQRLSSRGFILESGNGRGKYFNLGLLALSWKTLLFCRDEKFCFSSHWK